MTESLRDKLVSILSQVVTLHLSEAEVEDYPYAVYDMTSNPVMDKDGVARYEGETKITLVSDDFDEIETLRPQVEQAILSGMRDSVFSSRLIDVTKECMEGIWTIELNYTLRQYADWASQE